MANNPSYKKKIVILTGAGISAESGIATFRDSNGLWEGHDVMAVASPSGWQKNRALVLDFYNQRRRQLLNVMPNKAHFLLADLQANYDIEIITQNVDDLHERAGSEKVLHLHGELLSARSCQRAHLKYRWKKDILIGDKAEDGAQLRPDIVWFGEDVPAFEKAVKIAAQADIFVVIGTSLQVYPAASLMQYISQQCLLYYIDPHAEKSALKNAICIADVATTGVEKFIHTYLH